MIILCQILALALFTIGGTAVDSLTQRPLSKTKVSVASTAITLKSFTTGSDGRFHFDNLPGGKFTLSAERVGYPRQRYGQRTLYARYNSAVITAANQKTDDLTFRLIRGGVITGKVGELNGEPIPGLTIYVLQVAGIGKGRRVARYYQASTDDRGIYRVPFLPQGRFAVLAFGKPHQAEARAVNVHVAYPPTYFPSSTSPEGASLVEVRPGQESTADIVLTRGAAARLVGQVAGTPSENRSVYLSTPALYGFSVPIQTSPWLKDNSFKMEDLPPGRYVLTMMQDGTHRGAFQKVDISAPETPVTINETPPALITATVKLPSLNSTTTVAVRLHSVETGAVTQQRSFANGIAVFDAVQPGRYEPFAIVNRKEAAIISVKAQGVPLPPDSIITVPDTGKLELELTLDTAARDLTGKLVCDTGPCAGALAMLVKKVGWESAGAYKFDQSDTDGSFLWKAVPAGDYLMFAFENIDSADYDDPAVIRQLISHAQPLTVSGDVKETVTLYLTGSARK